MPRDHDAMLRYFPITREAAWRRYLEAVRSADPDGYADAEEAAWLELLADLTRVAERPAGAA